MRYAEILEEDVASAADDLALFEMANLGEKQTGIKGTIYISTEQGGHGPRVKYFEGRPGKGVPSMSVSIEAEPKMLANNLQDRVATRALPRVQRWVAQNHDKLLAFWSEGSSWMDEEVQAFKASLLPV